MSLDGHMHRWKELHAILGIQYYMVGIPLLCYCLGFECRCSTVLPRASSIFVGYSQWWRWWNIVIPNDFSNAIVQSSMIHATRNIFVITILVSYARPADRITYFMRAGVRTHPDESCWVQIFDSPPEATASLPITYAISGVLLSSLSNIISSNVAPPSPLGPDWNLPNMHGHNGWRHPLWQPYRRVLIQT